MIGFKMRILANKFYKQEQKLAKGPSKKDLAKSSKTSKKSSRRSSKKSKSVHVSRRNRTPATAYKGKPAFPQDAIIKKKQFGSLWRTKKARVGTHAWAWRESQKWSKDRWDALLSSLSVNSITWANNKPKPYWFKLGRRAPFRCDRDHTHRSGSCKLIGDKMRKLAVKFWKQEKALKKGGKSSAKKGKKGRGGKKSKKNKPFKSNRYKKPCPKGKRGNKCRAKRAARAKKNKMRNSPKAKAKRWAKKRKALQDAARLKEIMDKKKARMNRKSDVSGWDKAQAAKKKQRKADRQKLKKWKCKKGKKGRKCRKKRLAFKNKLNGVKTTPKASPKASSKSGASSSSPIKPGDPLDINMKLVDKRA